MKKIFLPLIVFFIFSCKPATEQKTGFQYPKTKKVEHTDDYFGVKVADPYRWLENDTTAETAAWVDEENKITFDYLNKIPFRGKIKERLEKIWNYEKRYTPYKKKDYYFFHKNDGLQNQSVLYYQKGLNGTPEILLDPNKLSADGTTALATFDVSHDGKYAAYATAKGGSDWNEMYVLELATKKLLTDHLEWIKFSGAAWKGEGFYYSRYDAPSKGGELSNANDFQKIYYHRLGDPQEKDVLIYVDKEHPKRYCGAAVSEDESFLILTTSEGTSGSTFYFMNLKKGDKKFIPVAEDFDNEYDFIDNVGENLLIKTNKNAPNYKLISVDSKNPSEKNWKDILPEKADAVFLRANRCGGKIIGTYSKDVSSRAYLYDMNGKLESEIEFPAMGTAGGFNGDKEDSIAFYSFTSFTFPSWIYKYNVLTKTSSLYWKPEIDFNLDEYETKQVFYESKDGAKIPMFIVHKKGLKMDGSNPTLLYAYGGFNANSNPGFNVSRLILLENGGVYVMANLRGGGEYGEEWHHAGWRYNKQNVFNDFIAAAEYLIKEKYTSSEKLAISGRSNGGLLVGACMTQRPELYKVAFPGVGVMDMLRYHKFTVGWGWAVEYGSSEDSLASFKNLYAYSPLHNLKDGVNYPATMVTTADHDDRVVPAHSFKFAATLQEKHKGENPVLIRIDKQAGHGGGKPTSKVIDEEADLWSFMFFNMNVTPKY